MSTECGSSDTRFIADRMLGTLTRYLRFMGYDTISANGFMSGSADEDTLLLALAHDEHRILLTRDHELARRGNDLAGTGNGRGCALAGAASWSIWASSNDACP